MEKISDEMREQLEKVMSEALSENAKASIKKICDELTSTVEDDLMYRVQDNMAYNLSHWTADMAQRAVEQMLEGNEDQMRRYLSCDKRGEDGQYIGWTGRGDGVHYGREREDRERHPVIHGKLFETGAISLRKKIVDAHRDLLVTERILDLEDQVKSLVAQVNHAKAEAERAFERGREYAA